MARGGGFLNNPAIIGAASALVTYIVVEELFDDPIEDFFDALKGKKKGGRGGRGGGKGGKKVKMVKNKFGEVYPVVEDDSGYGDESYFGAWERAYY